MSGCAQGLSEPHEAGNSKQGAMGRERGSEEVQDGERDLFCFSMVVLRLHY